MVLGREPTAALEATSSIVRENENRSYAVSAKSPHSPLTALDADQQLWGKLSYPGPSRPYYQPAFPNRCRNSMTMLMVICLPRNWDPDLPSRLLSASEV